MSKEQDKELDDIDDGPKTIVAMSAKQMKQKAKPEFAKNPDQYYPTSTLRRLGFERANCPVCTSNFWRHDRKKETCGDSQCEGKYSFIGVGTGRGREGKKITYAEAWEGFSRSLSSARVPCTPIARYPVVARWRADVDFVAAGIFCFQPYCVTGELEPPANPLICPQFCLRFNDLDNIGLTGRHYSGFIMLGIQVFNTPDNYKFWNHECVEFNYRWLTEELKINPDEITFIEDVWAGGGNLGPSIEYFVSGLELGNMVFMQFKTFPDGHWEPLQVQVIDVGIGLERVPWLINGSATSYCDVFPTALGYFLEKTGLTIENDAWDKFGPLSCLLNVDEVKDIEETWDRIASECKVPKDELRKAIDPIRHAYVVLDHTRCVLMAIEDGSLPSNVGGASNIRNVLRRVFAILRDWDWWKDFGMDGLIELFQMHKKDLEKIYGPFPTYKSFRPIIELEFDRWKTTDLKSKAKLDKLTKKAKADRPDGKLNMEDWIQAVTSYGLPADSVANITGEPIPGNLWYEIAARAECTLRVEAAQLYSTAHLPPTNSTYYQDHLQYDFDAKILEVMPNLSKSHEPSIVVLDRSAFYPTSGGQEHDTGTLTINDATYNVVDVLKVGPCVLHVLETPLPIDTKLEAWKGVPVTGSVDPTRREQLRNNHTATHIVYASSRKVLGPHVWQHGAKKNIHQAHLDITHYASVSHDEMMEIQTEANRIVHRCRDISKSFMPKDIAERKYGFHLYQGGVVPGNELRVVSIADTDTEACCGTHCDNTAEVGTIKLLKAVRISDGIVRLYYVAGENALQKLNSESAVLNGLINDWGVSQAEIGITANRFFEGYKKMTGQVSKQGSKILSLQMKCHLLDDERKLVAFHSEEDSPTFYITYLPAYAQGLQEKKKGVVFVGHNFVYGLVGDSSGFDIKLLDAAVQSINEEAQKQKTGDAKVKPGVFKKQTEVSAGGGKGKQAKKVTGILLFTGFSLPNMEPISKALTAGGFVFDQ